MIESGKIIEFQTDKLCPEPDMVYIKPVKFVFDDAEASALLAIDDVAKTYVYPMSIQMEKPPYSASLYIQEAILLGSTAFRDMMRRAYMEKKTIRIIGKCDVFWDEYEALFVKLPFYHEHPKAKILEMMFAPIDNKEFINKADSEGWE